MSDLAAYGVQVMPGKAANILCKVLSNSMNDADDKYIYYNVGWLNYKGKLIFRANEASGLDASYAGNLMIQPKGTYTTWEKMIKAEVIGSAERETALAIGFSASLYGLMYDTMNIESLFVHISGDSSSGKTTMGLLALSIGCCPDFDKPSLARTWGDTDNAIVKLLGGNHGYMVLLDEASQANNKDKTRIIYILTGNREKSRLRSDASHNPGGVWHTTVMSTGEYSLLSYAAENMGLRMRLIEFKDVQWTDDAGNSDRP